MAEATRPMFAKWNTLPHNVAMRVWYILALATCLLACNAQDASSLSATPTETASASSYARIWADSTEALDLTKFNSGSFTGAMQIFGTKCSADIVYSSIAGTDQIDVRGTGVLSYTIPTCSPGELPSTCANQQILAQNQAAQACSNLSASYSMLLQGTKLQVCNINVANSCVLLIPTN